MASPAGNPNSTAPFDVHKLFKSPPNPNPNNPGQTPPHLSPFAPSPSFPVTPPPGPFSYPPQTAPFHHPHHPFLHYPPDPMTAANPHQQLLPRPTIPFPANPNPTPNHGARLMALLGTTTTMGPTAPIETAASMPPPSSSLHSASSGEFSIPENPLVVLPAMAPLAPTEIGAIPARLPNSKQPRGRRLAFGDHAEYDVDVRDSQPPQLEVTPITKYLSDPGLVLGRQIAVNRTYICYGLRQGAIRVLNINTALRALLRGHTQRVTDMAFFAEDVHFLASASIDGRVFVWKINEGPDAEEKPQITEKVIVAIQIMGDAETFHPRLCWHCHKQEVLVVGIGNHVLKIDTNKVGRGEVFSSEEPLKCSVSKFIDGVQLIGKHDAEVTDLSMSQWMVTRLVSASKDGTVKIWDERKATPLVTLRPHEGQPVNSVAFLTAPHRPDHIVLITAGPLNREVKIWVSAGQEGWLLPSDSESWRCTQTLGLKSSADSRIEEAFFNQVVVLPSASLILLANAKKNAIYAVHVDYGPNPASTRMDYIAEFTVTMPILSLTGTSDCYSDGDQVVQVYCVQTHAIQQYALDVSQCLPPPLENVGLEDSSTSRSFEVSSLDGFSGQEPPRGITLSETPTGGTSEKQPSPVSISDNVSAVRYPVASVSGEMLSLHELAAVNVQTKPSAPPQSSKDADSVPVSSPSAILGPEVSGRVSGFGSPAKGFDYVPDQPAMELLCGSTVAGRLVSLPDVPSLADNSTKEEIKAGPNDKNVVPNPLIFKMDTNATHLVTPSEILSGAVSSTESTYLIQDMRGSGAKVQDVTVNNGVESVEVEVKVVGESGSSQHEELCSQKDSRGLTAENEENSVRSQIIETSIEMSKDCCASETGFFSVEEAHTVEDVCVTEAFKQPLNAGEEEIQDQMKDVLGKVSELAAVAAVTPSHSAAKGKKQKLKQSQASCSSSPPPSLFNSTDSLNEQVSGSSAPSTEAAFSQALATFQEMLNQVMAGQKEMQKQMSMTVSVLVTKEGKRVETAIGRSIEKTIKANNDALWARFQEEMAKREKQERDRLQQITNLITNSLSKDLPALTEKALKKEIGALGPTIARAISPIVEKNIVSAITDSFQKGVGDKAVSQLEKSVSSKLEPLVARQIQAQFQTSGKQALQDGLRSSLESSIVPAFELSCKAIFEQIDAAFQKGMAEHTSTAQQQLESTHTSLALTLRDAINSASAITQSLSGELADGQRKLLSLAAAGNQKLLDPMYAQQANGPLGVLHEVEASLDPTKELTRLISERKFEEAFTVALQRSDVSIVSWLCSQVDLQGICLTTPLPLSQGVLLALLQQLSCDIRKETPSKLGWMTQVAVFINPTDPTIAMHVRPIFEQIYQILAHQKSLPATTPAESNSIRLIMHVINSVLTTCK